ncbi:hypothetical protein [Leptospira ilyithenensis]|uniref:Uncharacterized protein n=1 Tax=Leptospira ilyithenensis TaxID=2484901 RepID=A0A4R9LVB3_9LEPT|nr:hypothetical protein [Leptospira ilyithenensis]TGN11839.1 hypothetical protein EHS11_04835 [Leptospira ilyithenensis]
MQTENPSEQRFTKMRGAQQKIDKVSPLLKAREMFLAVAEAGMPERTRRNTEVTRGRAWNIERLTERRDGLIKWGELRRDAQSIESKSDIATLKAELKATKSSVIDFSTGTESVLSSYDDSLTRLTTKEFIFNEPIQKQAVITQNTSMGLGEFFSKDRSLSEVSKISVSDKVSTMGSFSLGGVAAGIGLVQTDPVIYKTISLVESAAGAVGGFVSSLTGNTSGGQSYSIFNAASLAKTILLGKISNILDKTNLVL